MEIGTDITVCIPTLNRYDLLAKCIESLYDGRIHPKEIVVINNGRQDITSVSGIPMKNFGYNLGVAKSWNWFIKNVEFPILICNDDLEFGKNDILNINNAMALRLGEFYYTNNISHLNMFSCFAPTEECIKKVGLFDEEFFPAYFEDNDYFHRMQLNKIKLFAIDTELSHVGSATIRQFGPDAMNLHHEAFRKNKAYYIKKWGGEPHQETYERPFNES